MTSRVGLFGCLSLASFAMASCASDASAAAGIQILSQNDTSLSVKFTSAAEQDKTISFSRPTTDDLWKAQVAVGADQEIIFGNSSPVFGSTARLQELSISAPEALRTFTAAIASSTVDDVTIYRLYAGEVAIALWQDDVITEIWLAGEMVDDLLSDTALTTCQAAQNNYCKKKPTPNPGFGDPLEYPWPTINNCVAAIQQCGNAISAAACACLSSACLFCQTYPDLCESIPGLVERSEDACAAHVNHCLNPPHPQNLQPIVDVLVEILNRAQVILDSQS